MEYIAKVTLYHNTKGLIEEGQTVELTKEEVAEETADVDEEPTDSTEEKPKAKAKGKKAEETAE